MIVRVLLAVGVLYALYCAVGFALQRKLLFPGAWMEPFAPVRPEGVQGLERLWIENGAGRSEAWFLPAGGGQRSDGKGRPAVLFAHGNGEHIDDWVEALRPFNAMGVHLLLLEYPGYGRSTGSPSEATIGVALLGAYDWLRADPRVDPDRIVGFGRSLGGAAVVKLAAERPVAALVLQSAFTSVTAMAVRAYFVPPFLIRDPFRSLERLRTYRGPVLVMHGGRDRIVPIEHARALVAAAPDARLHALDCGHNDCPPSWPDFWSRIAAFLVEERVIGPSERPHIGPPGPEGP